MKKIFSVVLMLTIILSFTACSKIALKENEISVNENQTVETNLNNSESDTSQNTESKINENSQNKKIIITPDVQNAKLSFSNSNDTVTNINKSYSVDKKSKTEDYIDKSITEKTISFLGKEFKNVPYSKSEKNIYKETDEDVFLNKEIQVITTKSGDITSFYTFIPFNIFPNENKNSVELAKKYLNAIMPNFKYDQVDELKPNYSDITWYSFGNIINGIPISESVTIALNSKGEIASFHSNDIGMYDNIEIKGVDKDVYLKKVDEFIKSTYGDSIKGYRIGDDGPHYEIYKDNKLELSVPVEIDAVISGNDISYGEYIVLELN